MFCATFSEPFIGEKQNLCNLTITLLEKDIFHVHQGVCCFGNRGSEVLHNRCCSDKNTELHQVQRVDLSDLQDVVAADIRQVLEYIYTGTLPLLQHNNIEQILRLHNAAKELKVHTLLALLRSFLLQYVQTTSNQHLIKSMHHAAFQKLISLVEKQVLEEQQALSALMISFCEAKFLTITDNDRIHLCQSLASHASKTSQKKLQKARTKRLRRVSTLVAERGYELKATIDSGGDSVVDAVEEPEEQEEEEEEEMQQAIVVRDFVCSATMVDSECVSISEGEYVYVILYDIDSGWAGVLKVNGQKGYVPIYCIVRKMSRLKSEKVEENIGQEVTFESTSTTCNSTQERRRGRRRSLKMSPQMNDDDSLDHVRKK